MLPFLLMTWGTAGLAALLGLASRRLAEQAAEAVDKTAQAAERLVEHAAKEE